MPRRPPAAPLIAATLAAVAVFGSTAVAMSGVDPPVRLADACRPHRPPQGDGVDFAVQQLVIAELDRASCALEATREELFVAMVQDEAAESFERNHGTDPRGLFRRLLEGLARLDVSLIPRLLGRVH